MKIIATLIGGIAAGIVIAGFTLSCQKCEPIDPDEVAAMAQVPQWMTDIMTGTPENAVTVAMNEDKPPEHRARGLSRLMDFKTPKWRKVMHNAAQHILDTVKPGPTYDETQHLVNTAKIALRSKS